MNQTQIQEKGSISSKTSGEIVSQKQDIEVAETGRADAEQSSTEKVQIQWWTSNQETENRPKNVYGFENEVLSLKHLLGQRENEGNIFKAVGIVGMRGIGKTTLCQQILDSPEMKNEYLPRIWINMNENNTILATVERLLESVGVHGEKIVKDGESQNSDSLKALLCALHRHLWGKRYLIVLDDVRESKDDDWYEDLSCCANNGEEFGNRLVHGLPKGCGGTVIVTSRDEELTKKLVGLEETNLYRLEPFSDPVSFWEIFTDAVGEDGKKRFVNNLENLQEHVLKKCRGVPLAAKTMGNAVGRQFRDRLCENN